MWAIAQSLVKAGVFSGIGEPFCTHGLQERYREGAFNQEMIRGWIFN